MEGGWGKGQGLFQFNKTKSGKNILQFSTFSYSSLDLASFFDSS